MTDKMNNLKLTKWLQIVWEALREQDDLKRSRMLRVADRLLKAKISRRLHHVEHKTVSTEYESLNNACTGSERSNCGQELTKPKRQLLGGGAV